MDGSTHAALSQLAHGESEPLARDSVLSYIATPRRVLFKEGTEKELG